MTTFLTALAWVSIAPIGSILLIWLSDLYDNRKERNDVHHQ